MKYLMCCSVAALLGAAGLVHAQPVLDGRLDASYGPLQWKQTIPTNFGDASLPPFNCTPIGLGIEAALDNTNRAGVVGGFPVATLTPAQMTAAGAVTTGAEFKIPLSEIGSPTGAIRIAGFVTNSNYSNFSSQVIGGIGGNTTAGGYPGSGTVDLSLVAGDQFVTVPLAGGSGTPVLDGQLDAAFYGAALTVQDTTSNYGDAVAPVVPADSIFKAAGGSEIAAVYARVSGGNLYVFVAGNIESNFNKLNLFIDTGVTTPATAAQNVLLNTNNNPTNVFDGGPNAMAGLKFDAAFNANYWVSLATGGGPELLFLDFAKLGTEADGGNMRSLNVAGTTTNPFVAGACPPPPTASPDTAGGSEINGLYATVCGQFLYLFIPGNLETNGNWLDLFFDVGSTTIPLASTGQQQLLGTNVTVGTDALGRMGPDPLDPALLPGLRFSNGFLADYFIAFRNQGSPVDVFAIAALLNTTGALNDGLPVVDPNNPNGPARPSAFEYGSFVGGPKSLNSPLSFDGQFCVRPVPVPVGGTCMANGFGTFWNPAPGIPGIDVQGDAGGAANNPTQVPVIRDIFSSFAPRLISQNAFDPLNRGTPTSPTANPVSLAQPGLIRIAIDNSNRGGITGASATFAASVTTGIEVRVRLDEIGYSGTGPIRVTGWINGGDHGFLSNQIIGGAMLPAQSNLGDPRAIDFAFVQGTGPFYVTIDPGTCVDAPTGACCFGANNEVCSIMSSAQCTATIAGGNFRGAGTTCTPGVCTGTVTTGRCCVGARCLTGVTEAACTAAINNNAGAVFALGQAGCNQLTPNINSTSPCCLANYNKAGGISVQDIFDFLGAWFSNSPNADINAGGLSVNDIFDFLAAWFSGGCN
jgi:hypothetical protein